MTIRQFVRVQTKRVWYELWKANAEINDFFQYICRDLYKREIMRLTVKEKDVISSNAKQIFGSDTAVVLFGSRANDASRGGDIDLLIIPPVDSLRSEFFNKKIKFIVQVLDRIGDQKIDVIIKYPDDTRGIIQTAINEGVRIC